VESQKAYLEAKKAKEKALKQKKDDKKKAQMANN